MEAISPRIILIGGTYRALCLLERLLERGERVVAFIGQEGGEERDFCPEILEVCDRNAIPARSAHKLGEEIVRWLEDRIRPDLAIAVGASMEIPLAVGGNTRLGLIEVIDCLANETCAGVALRQRGQEILARKLPALAEHEDPGDAYLQVVETVVELLDEFLDRLPRTASEKPVQVPFGPRPFDPALLGRVTERPDPGSETDILEREVAEYVGAEAVVALRSTADAFELLAEALELGEDDRFICPGVVSGTLVATLQSRGVPIEFADVEPRTLTLDPASVAERAPDARALVISHAFGQPAALDQLYPIAEAHGLEVIEDGGASLGARFEQSRLGRAPCTTVFRLPVGAGDGGGDAVLLTLAPGLAERIVPVAGDRRLGDGAAAIARRALAAQDDALAARRRNALLYSSELSRYDAFRVPATPAERLPTYAAYALGVTRFARTSAEDLQKLLAESGIETRRVSVPPRHRDLTDLPVTEQARLSSLLLPVHPDLDESQITQILDEIFGYAIG
jgi:dTDP-4-amino-4,6-dideoxygalactose transaminase